MDETSGEGRFLLNPNKIVQRPDTAPPQQWEYGQSSNSFPQLHEDALVVYDVNGSCT